MTPVSLRNALLVALGWTGGCGPSLPDRVDRPPPAKGTERRLPANLCTAVPDAPTGAVDCRIVETMVHVDSGVSCLEDEECALPETCVPQGLGQSRCARLRPETCQTSADCTSGTTCVVEVVGHPGRCVVDRCQQCAEGTVCSRFVEGTLSGVGCLPPSFTPPPGEKRNPELVTDAAAGQWLDGTYLLRGPPASPCDDGTLRCEGKDGRWTCVRPAMRFVPCGRPLFVDGTARVATVRHGARIEGPFDVPSQVAERFLRIALDEHASIAAFAQTLLYLSALGAPSSLVAETARALADEIRHADQAFALASQMAGTTLSPGPLPQALLTLSIDDLPLAFLRDVVKGGCVGETCSVLAAVELFETAPPAARPFLETVVADETRHAALAFKTVAWLCNAFPSLRDALPATVAGATRDVPEALRETLIGPLFSGLLARSMA